MNEPVRRRTFLKSAAGAGLAAAQGAAQATGDHKQQDTVRNPKPVRLGIIGMGRRGRNILRAIEDNRDLIVVAICDVYEPNLELAAKMVPGARKYRDFRKVIASDEVDAVCVATPDHWHAYMTIEACKAGKDVYVEKPVSVTVREGRLMVEAARKYGRIVQVGTQQRSAPHFQQAAEIVQAGEIGPISFVRTWNYGNAYPEGIGSPPDSEPPENLDWDMWLGPAPERPFNPNRFGVDPDAYSHFRWFWDYAGGMMTDWGVHLLDIVLWAMEVKGPQAICASGGKTYLNDNRETPDTLQVTYEFPDFYCVYENRVLNGNSMWDQSYGITFHGTKGTLFVDRGRWEIYPETKLAGEGEGGGRQVAGRMLPSAGYREGNSTALHWEDFVTAVRTRKRPISDIEVGHRSTATAILGNVALRSRERVVWDPENETTPNEEARQYLSREHREPWTLEL